MQMTLKEKRAKEKQAKKVKQLERTAKNNAQKAKQPIPVLKQIWHMKNRERLVYHAIHFGGTEFSESEIQQQRQIMQSQLENLIYYRNMSETIADMEMTIRAAQIMTDILSSTSPHCAKDLQDSINKAIDEMEFAQVYDMSPNQRRAAFKELECVFDLMCIWLKVFSKEVIDTIKSVNTATQICHYFANLYEKIHDTVNLMEIINGKNAREMAKQLGMKEMDLKIKLLNTAKSLYRIALTQAECVKSGLYAPSSIPDLRQKAFKHLANFDFLSQLSANCLQDVIKPFFREYHIDLLRINQYEVKIAQVAKANLFQAA